MTNLSLDQVTARDSGCCSLITRAIGNSGQQENCEKLHGCYDWETKTGKWAKNNTKCENSYSTKHY